MAEEKIVFEVDVTSLAKGLADSQTQLEIYKRDMELAIEANGKFSEQANKAAGLVAAQTKAVQQQTGAITRLTQAELALGGSINDVVKNYKAEENSVNTNRKVLNALTAEYNKLTGVQRTNLIPTIKAVSDTLKQQEGVIGDTRRNVGNYFNEFAKGVPQLGAAVEGIKGVGVAFKGAGGGVAGLSAGLATLGLPLIIAGVTALIDVFKEFKPVADAIESSVTAIKAAFGALISGNSISEAVSQSLELLNVMRDLEDTQQAFTITLEKYNNQIQRLIIASKDRTKSDKDRLALVNEANELEKKSFAETVKRLDDEIAVRERNFKAQTKINSAQLKLLAEGTSGAALNLRNQLEKNTAFKEKDLEILQGLLLQREKFSGDSLALQEKLANNTNKLQDELKAEAEKRATEEAKRIDAQNKRAELAASLYNKTQEEKLAALKKFDDAAKKAEENRIAELSKQFNLEKQFADNQLQIDLGYADLSVASEEDKFKRKQEIQINYLQRQLDDAIQFLGADGSITKAELQGIEAIRLALAKAKASTFAPTTNSKGEKETFGSALGLDAGTLKEVSGGLQIAGDVINGISSIASAATQVRLNEIDAETNAEIQKVNQSTLSEEEKVKKISAINAKANKEKYEAEKAAFETNKALQIVNAIIGTAVGVINAFQLGPIAGAIMAAVIAATGVAQIAVIASQAPPPPPNKFATGVIGLDGAGTETSDSIDARLSKGESVLTAKATRKYHRQLAYMEMSVGNKPNYQFGGGMFAGGFIPSVSGDGGFLARETVKQSDSALMMSEAIRNGFSNAPAPVLSIVELNTKQRDINRSVNLSEA